MSLWNTVNYCWKNNSFHVCCTLLRRVNYRMLVAVDAGNYGKKQLEPAAFKVKPRAWRLSSLVIPGRIHIIALATA